MACAHSGRSKCLFLVWRKLACHSLAVFSLIPSQVLGGIAIRAWLCCVVRASGSHLLMGDDLASSLEHNSLENASYRPGGAGSRASVSYDWALCDPEAMAPWHVFQLSCPCHLSVGCFIRPAFFQTGSETGSDGPLKPQGRGYPQGVFHSCAQTSLDFPSQFQKSPLLE